MDNAEKTIISNLHLEDGVLSLPAVAIPVFSLDLNGSGISTDYITVDVDNYGDLMLDLTIDDNEILELMSEDVIVAYLQDKNYEVR